MSIETLILIILVSSVLSSMGLDPVIYNSVMAVLTSSLGMEQQLEAMWLPGSLTLSGHSVGEFYILTDNGLVDYISSLKCTRNASTQLSFMKNFLYLDKDRGVVNFFLYSNYSNPCDLRVFIDGYEAVWNQQTLCYSLDLKEIATQDIKTVSSITDQPVFEIRTNSTLTKYR